MKRTITERKIWNQIALYFSFNVINILILGISIYKEWIIIQIIVIPSIILLQVALVYQGYKLGWEYRKFANESNQVHSHQNERARNRKVDGISKEMTRRASQSASNKLDMGNSDDALGLNDGEKVE